MKKENLNPLPAHMKENHEEYVSDRKTQIKESSYVNFAELIIQKSFEQ